MFVDDALLGETFAFILMITCRRSLRTPTCTGLNQLTMRSTPVDSNSNLNRIPMGFLHTFTVILPSVTRTSR